MNSPVEVMVFSYASPGQRALAAWVLNRLHGRGVRSLAWVENLGADPLDRLIERLPESLGWTAGLCARAARRALAPLQREFGRKLTASLNAARPVWNAPRATPGQAALAEEAFFDPAEIEAARQLDIRCYRVRGLGSAPGLRLLKTLAPRLVVYFGGVLPERVLQATPARFLNAHAGARLPGLRGNDSYEWAILRNEPLYVNTHLIERGIDTGPVLEQRLLPRLPGDSLSDLTRRMQHLRAEMMVEAVCGLRDGTLTPQPQPTHSDLPCYRMHFLLRALLADRVAQQ